MAEVSSTVNRDEQDRDFGEKWDGSDVTFIVENKKLYGSRLILGMWSPVFKAMFNSDFKEKNAEEIPLLGKTYEDIVHLLKVTHPPTAPITDENVGIILQLSREYQLDRMLAICESYMLSKPPLLRYLAYAREYGLTYLEKTCNDYVKNTPWVKLKEENDFEDIVKDPCAEIFKDIIDAQTNLVATLKKLKDITVIKKRECSSCQNSRCVDCDGQFSWTVRNMK